MFQMFNFITALLAALLMSCAHDGQSPNALTKTYERNLSFTVNGVRASGTLVAEPAASYKIVIDLPNKAEVITITDCHRWLKFEKSGWFNRTQHTYTYTPADGVETKGFCPLRIAAFDLDGQNAWGIIEFNNRDLPATLQCNGTTEYTNGVSLCQSHEGLEQRITFSEPVDYEPANLPGTECPKLISLQTMSGYKIPLAKGECVYVFLGLDSRRSGRLMTFGYDSFFYKSIKAENQ